MATITQSRKTSSRVVLNRSRLSRVRGALADGLAAVAEAVIEASDPPDATPFGEGLVTTGGTYVVVDGKKVSGNASKPRGAKVPKPGIMAIAGFGFPGRFQELGTIHQPARPFLTPAMQKVAPAAPTIMAVPVKAQLRTIP
jgi:hypothetical protein